MRDQMPTCAQWVDELRDAFGKSDVDAAIREGMKADAEFRFHAAEGEHAIGRPNDRDGYVQAFVLPEPARDPRQRSRGAA